MEKTNTSPPSCPRTVTVRRNPPRRARNTPYTANAVKTSEICSLSEPLDIPAFPIDEILKIPIPKSEPEPSVSESLKVFLRIKPLKSCVKPVNIRPKNAWPQNPPKKTKSGNEKGNLMKMKKKSEEACVTVNDSHSVTLTPPTASQELKRSKTEVYEGFSHVFPATSSQGEVFERMVSPLVEDFLKGKSGMLAALGPSGSGKTHTVFGSPREPGMVPRALKIIFKLKDDRSKGPSRSFHMSVFEIYSERGKGERASDLLEDSGSELSMQQSTIRGIKEVLITNHSEAESLIAQAMLRRATAMTNSNSQSSRSQCIINIRAATSDGSPDKTLHSSDAMLTIVDLAGAEREKRTGNQGARLLESNFINNTSMVFGQCLRSLLEHQKNPKKALQKHFQNSLLTRYLRDYLEGKKRMALMLTIKAGEEDYLDTSFLLKQASPYMKIKFDNVEEICNKRQLQGFSRVEQHKRIKLSGSTTSGTEEVGDADKKKPSKEGRSRNIKADVNNSSSPTVESVEHYKSERSHMIMKIFAKAIWNVLKQYNESLKVAESEIQMLRLNLEDEQMKRHGLEKELVEIKSSCSCSKQNLAEISFREVEASLLSREEYKEPEVSLVDEVQRTVGAQSPTVSASESHDNLQNNLDLSTSSKDVCDKSSEDGNSKVSSNNSRKSGPKDDYPEPNVKGKGIGVISFQSTGTARSSSSTSMEFARKSLKDDEVCDKSSEDGNSNESANNSKQSGPKDDYPEMNVKGTGVNPSQSSGAAGSSSSASKEFPRKPLQDDEDDQAQQHLPDGEQISQRRYSKQPDIQTKLDSAKPLKPVKPKRRLLPASSVLLVKEMSTLDIEDEINKPKAGRGGKKASADEQHRTQGNINLLRMLKTNLHL